MSTADSSLSEEVAKQAAEARARLNEHTLKTVHWHFSEETGSPFWLEKKAELKFDPLTEIKCFDDPEKSFRCSRTTGCEAARFANGCQKDMRASQLMSSRPAARRGFPKAVS